MDWRDSDLYDDKRWINRKYVLEKMIKKREDRIEKNKFERKQYQTELKDIEKKLSKFSKLWKPNPQIKHKPQKTNGIKNGKFYHQMEISQFWGGKMYVTIGNDDIYKTKTDDEWREKGKKEYKRRMSTIDKEYLTEIKVKFE